MAVALPPAPPAPAFGLPDVPATPAPPRPPVATAEFVVAVDVLVWLFVAGAGCPSAPGPPGAPFTVTVVMMISPRSDGVPVGRTRR